MKKKAELNVDYIGGQGPLTKEEEAAISEYLRRQKNTSVKKKPGRLKRRAKTQA